eukprot:scaffold74431_cov69-Phaeocystis_antarctica.AAC.2
MLNYRSLKLVCLSTELSLYLSGNLKKINTRTFGRCRRWHGAEGEGSPSPSPLLRGEVRCAPLREDTTLRGVHVPPTHSTDHRDCVGTAAPLRGARGHVDVSSSHAIVTRVATSASRAGLSLYRFTLPFVIDCGCEHKVTQYTGYTLYTAWDLPCVWPLLIPRCSALYGYHNNIVSHTLPTSSPGHHALPRAGASAPIPPPPPPRPPYDIATPMSMIYSSRLLLVFASPLSCISRALARCSSVSMHYRLGSKEGCDTASVWSGRFWGPAVCLGLQCLRRGRSVPRQQPLCERRAASSQPLGWRDGRARARSSQRTLRRAT